MVFNMFSGFSEFLKNRALFRDEYKAACSTPAYKDYIKLIQNELTMICMDALSTYI